MCNILYINMDIEFQSKSEAVLKWFYLQYHPNPLGAAPKSPGSKSLPLIFTHPVIFFFPSKSGAHN